MEMLIIVLKYLETTIYMEISIIWPIVWKAYCQLYKWAMFHLLLMVIRCARRYAVGWGVGKQGGVAEE